MKKVILVLSIILITFITAVMLVPIPNLELDYSKVLLSDEGKLLSAKISSDQQWRFPIEGDLPDQLEKSILLFEDEYFYYHLGVNPIAICKAVYQNWKAKKIVRGGSTITMQLMRMYRGNQSRTHKQKLIEILGAIKLELLHDKKEIVRMWANIAPFGGNTVGASTAAWRYYNRPLDQLSISEYATLAVLPNAPSQIHMEKNLKALTLKRNRLLIKLHDHNYIDQTELKLALNEEIYFSKSKIPTHSIHLLELLIKEYPEQNIFRSTVDDFLQKTTKEILQEHTAIYQHDGIQNAAAIIIDHKSNKLVSYIGNTKNSANQINYVDCASAPRSYGSLLKPFLYSYAIDQGYFLPNELIKDIPSNINGFTPKNFDRKFRGIVPMDWMVSQSLNVPAVRVLNYVGLESFHNILVKQLEFKYIKSDPNHHGLSLILGGAEANLLELANSYKGLARNLNQSDRSFIPLNYLKNETKDRNSYFHFDPITVSYALKAMQSLNRPEDEQHFTKYNGNNIAWKTGTSYGHRDAWSIGINGQYVVAVWVGNEDGSSAYDLVGGKKAAPILFKMFRHLQSGGDITYPIFDSNQIQVCSLSGQMKGKYCSHTHTLDVSKISHQLRQCTFHKKIQSQNKVDTIFSLNPTENYYAESFGNQKYLPERTEMNTTNHNILEIVYPMENSVLMVPKKLASNYAQVELKASSMNASDTLFWYIDNQFVEASKAPHKIYAHLDDGKHEIHINDAMGNEASLDFEVVRR